MNIDKELIQDEIDRRNAAMDYVDDLLYEGNDSLNEAVLTASRRFNVPLKYIYENLR